MHDLRYKKIFTYPSIVEDLLRSFVIEDFVSDLDFSTLKKLNTSFVSPSFRKREADVIYEIRGKYEMQYIYILLEFQSTVDRFMALRMGRYVFEFQEEVLKLNKGMYLNPVFPILIYNGDAKWTAPERYSDLLVKSNVPKKYLPEFRYFKIAINEIPKRELVKIRNAIATIFYFENCTPEDIINNRIELVGLLKSVFLREGREIVQTIVDWIYASNKISEPAGKINSIESIMEVESMLETAVIRHENKMIEKGMEKGMEKKNLEVALKMLANGISVSMVKKVTGLSNSKIAVLKKNVAIGNS